MDVRVTFLLALVPCMCVGFELPNHLIGDRYDEIDIIRVGGCTFTVDRRHALFGHNDEVLHGLTAEECLETCAKTKACLSIDRNVNRNRKCILSHSSKTTSFEDFGPHGRTDYFHKVNCETELADDEEIIDGQCIKTYGPFGRRAGDAFSDMDLFMKNHGPISEIVFRHGYYTDCISFTYGRGSQATKGPCHGGDGGEAEVITLLENEYVAGIQGMAGDLIDEITIITNLDSYGPFGIRSGEDITVDSEGRRLAYISGQAGNLVDQLSFHFHC